MSGETVPVMTKKMLGKTADTVPRPRSGKNGRHGAHRLLANESGATAVIAAILFPVVIGGMGLGVETGYWYLTQRKLQHSADVAVHAAAVRKRAGDQNTAIETAALHIASKTGYSPVVGTLLVNTPPATGTNAGNRDSVEVVIAETHPRLFSSVFSSKPVKIRARAVAQVHGGSKACVLALSKTKSGAVTVSGSTSVDLTNCNVASNSNAADSFLMSGSTAAIATDCVYTVGEAVTTAGLTLKQCAEVRDYAPTAIDPYASIAEPANVGTCRNKNVGSPGNSTTLTPSENHPSGVKAMRFCGGLDLKGKVTFAPGLYIIDGGTFTANGGDIGSTAGVQIVGSGVTFYFANNATAKLTGNLAISLSAPTSGPFSGLLFFGSRTATNVSHQVSGTSGSVLQGALYTPASAIEYKGNSAATDGCTQVIADTVTLTGNSTVQSTCENAGTRDVMVGQVVTIVE
ncbi:pilus assembly protein TadG-related protein [Mesorhizobium sp. M00.F.Ca.ET.216.01.1.1]|uniref:pilus assembly protein TadG-related protein n=1 Tax=Mesorhizobium sp. M00.F.Ca.ET.216.01.1.1 TaxID=2500528 RepID=UPI001FE01404|nr:pilus assembly protein TadG-related protein [Mesorhizobium sp. M00.F.Ca.ET.216.01.1.1]